MPLPTSLLEQAIARFSEMLAAHSADDVMKTSGQVGEHFLEGAAFPGTFVKGRYNASTPEGLAAQFDTSTPSLIPPELPGQLELHEVRDPTSAGRAYYSIGDRASLDSHLEHPQFSPGIVPYLESGQLPKDARYYHADTSTLNEGSGSGKRFYGVLNGTLANDPGAINYADLLTGANPYRRSLNIATALAREPNLAGRLLISPQQLADAPGLNAVDLSLRGSAPEQIGALHMVGGLETLKRLQSAVSHTKAKLGAERLGLQAGDPTASARRADSLDNAYAMMRTLSQEMFSDRARPRTFEDLAALARLQPVGKALGPTSLAKARIAHDALLGTFTNPQLFRGSEFAKGGPVGGLAVLSGDRALGG